MVEQAVLEETKKEIVEVELDALLVSRYQPRQAFADEELKELAESIRQVGIIQPPVVRVLFDGSYELISGERRVRASKLAGLQKIPVIIQRSSEKISAQAALIENLQRVDLNPMEIAEALRDLSEEFKFNQEELAVKVGKKRSTVANYLRLLTLPKAVQDSINQGKISMGHAKVILSVVGLENQMFLHNCILKQNLTVRDAEKSSATLMGKKEKRKEEGESEGTQDLFLKDIERSLQQKLKTRVTVQPQNRQGSRGKVLIDFYSFDDLDDLVKNLLGDEHIF